jgi:hypothetical protein
VDDIVDVILVSIAIMMIMIILTHIEHSI